jgi:RNA polymerase sigma-70 factor (ECF subfamily)
MTLCGNETLAEDLAQDTLVEAWKSLRRYNGHCQFFTWLCAILLNRYRNAIRARRPAPLASLRPEQADEFRDSLANLPDGNSLPDESANLQERAALVMECLEKLPGKHREIIYLRFYVDDSLEGIASALGCSVGTVKSRLFRALENLRAMNVLQSINLETKVGVL